MAKYALLLICSLPSFAQLTVDTVAGGKVVSGVPAQNVSLFYPSGITHDASGRVVFTESYVIRRIEADGTLQTIAGTGQSGETGDGGPATQARLSVPSYPRYDSLGNLFFADGFRIRRIDTKGIITTVAGTGISGSLGADGPATMAQVGSIADLAVEKAGDVYFSEPSQNRIRRLTPAGKIELIAGNGASKCDPTQDGVPAIRIAVCPTSITVDSSGNLYLFDGLFLMRIGPDGILKKFAGFGTGACCGDGGPAANAQFPTQGPLTVSSSGDISIATSEVQPNGTNLEYVIRKITSDGTISLVPGSANLSTAQSSLGPLAGFSFQDLVIGDAGQIYATVGFQVVEITAQGTVQSLAGSSPSHAPDGTPARQAWLSAPNTIAVSKSGTLYISDNCKIWKVGSDGLLTTAANLTDCAVAFMAVDSHERIYYSSYPSPNGTLSMITSIAPDGTKTTTQAGPGPASLAIDSKDRLYVFPYFANSPPVGPFRPPILQRLNPDGSMDQLGYNITVPTNSPGIGAYLATDSSDNLYAQPTMGSQVVGYSETGKAIADFATSAFVAPFAIAPDGSLWEGTSTSGLTRFALSPSFLPTLLSSPKPGYSGDGGPLASARFAAYYPTGGPTSQYLVNGVPEYLAAGAGTYSSYRPYNLVPAFSPSGDLYLLDIGNRAVRKVSGAVPRNLPAVSQGGVVNAASLQAGPIAPGELVTIFGSNFGSGALQVSMPDNNSVPTALGDISVYIGPALAPITAYTPNQINAFVPYEVAGMKTANIRVVVDGANSATVTVPVASSAFGISTIDASGSGQAAILNQDGSVNSTANPAAQGSVITLFGTGEGVTTPALPDGALVLSTPFSAPDGPVTVTIGGQPAQVLYAGAAPDLPTGVLQIDAQVPTGIPSGADVISVSIAGSATSQNVTLSVK